jgi:hypothetical protein
MGAAVKKYGRRARGAKAHLHALAKPKYGGAKVLESPIYGLRVKRVILTAA